MRLHKFIFFSTFICISVNSSAGFFDELDKALETTGKILNTTSSTQDKVILSDSTQSVPIMSATNAQIQNIEKALQVITDNSVLNQAFSEARENISHLLLVGSCQTDGRLLIGSILSPNAFVDSMKPAMDLTQYHSKDQCMTVQNIGNWEMPTKNALRFVVVYVSDASGEAQRRQVEMVKENNQWLVTRHSIKY